MRTLSLTLLTAFSLSTAACDDGADSTPVEEPKPTSELGEQGEEIYRNTVDDGNSFTCATCHALTEPATGLRRVGHSIGDAAARPSFKNGQVGELHDAVNSCLQEWMNAEPWTTDDERWVALEAFMTEIAPASADALTFSVLAPPSANELSGGDAERGRATFNASCAECHGDDGVGTTRGLPIAGRALDPEYIGRRVRTSGRSDSTVYAGLTGGVMPFWAADRLSPEELVDIVAWLSMDEGVADDDGADDGVDDGPADDGMDDGMDDGVDDGPADDGMDDGPADDGMDDGGSGTDGGADDGMDDGGPTGNCPATHPKIGQTAVLQEFFHDVAGTAEIVDDCTIRITGFDYDAEGIVVQLYGGLGGDYDNGFAMGDDLVGPVPFNNATVDFELPQGMTMDDLDGVSVWCVNIGIDFGSGNFQ